MYNKFFLGAALMILSACAGAGRGLGIDFNLIPTHRLDVTNSCYGTTLLVRTPDGEETPIRYGNVATVTIRNFNGGRMDVTARGVGEDGLYVGTTSKTVRLQSGTTHDDWNITSLRGGQRSCRAPRSSRS